MRRWISRAGWLLSVGTIVTAASLVPFLFDRPELEWMEWLGVVGSLVGAVIIRFGSPSTFLAAAVVAFVANMAFVALVVGFIVHLVERQTKRGPAHA